MNYLKIYNSLIDRGKTRILKEYSEKHHIIPKCMGGDDSKDNLVDLTPEEHYVAHQLLVKIYPNNHSLIKAAQMMIPNRPSNKCYGWLRRKLSVVMSESQTGTGNSQYGTRWIHNLHLKESKKIPKNDTLPDGWLEGRKIENWETERTCKGCGKKFKFKELERYCSPMCKQQHFDPFKGKEEEFLTYYKQHGSMNKALKAMGYPGAVSHYYRWGKKVLDIRK
jgi:hypothetical protein